MSKVEVFKAVETVETNEDFITFCPDQFQDSPLDFNPMNNMKVTYKRLPIRTVAEQRIVSFHTPEKYRQIDINNLRKSGYSPVESFDPRSERYRKEKRFVIEEDMIDSFFSQKRENIEPFGELSTKLLFIEQTKDVNILKAELKSKNEAFGNCKYEYGQLKNELTYLKSRTLFQRIFKWKKIK